MHNRSMAKRTSNLLARGLDTVGKALCHPAQLRACEIIERLITRLRTLDVPKDYYEFQRLLVEYLIEVERRQAEATRNVKRRKAGKAVPTAPVDTWEIEQIVFDRIARQLRSIGDGLAWRMHGFDRRVIIALSQNDPSGPMYGKRGVEREFEVLQTIWHNEGAFALLHGATNCIRIADVTKFVGGRALLVEVKEKRTGPTPMQMRRIQAAIDAINSGAPLQGHDGNLSAMFVTEQPFKTYLGELGTALEQADADGISTTRLGHQWVATCLSFISPSLADEVEAMHRLAEMRARAFKKAGMVGAAQHHLRGVRPDGVGRDPTLAPFAIYPFSPDVCARLTCDLVHYESVLGWERLAGAFRSHGFKTECPFPASSGPVMGADPVLKAVQGTRGLTIHASGVNQILFELVEPKAWAGAAAESFDRWSASLPPSGIFTFSNERAVWC